MRPSRGSEGNVITATTLLGHLARFSSFTKQGEVLCTRGLGYLLQEHSGAGSAFAAEIASRAHVALGDGLSWHADERQESDDARPDVEGRSAGKPVVKIEAKLGAAFAPGQLASYAADLQKALEKRRLDGVLAVLVPRGRVGAATREVKETFSVKGPGPWRTETCRRVSIVVVSWNDILDMLAQVNSERFRYELEQFTAMYWELGGSYIEPLAADEDVARSRERRADLKKVVTRVTDRLAAETNDVPAKFRRPTWQTDREESSHELRHVVGAKDESYFSIGLRDPFQGSDTPIWLRFYKKTGGFPAIRQRIESSDLPWKLSGGHIWIPLEVPREVGADEMVEAVVHQVKRIARVAYPQETWHTP